MSAMRCETKIRNENGRVYEEQCGAAERPEMTLGEMSCVKKANYYSN